VPQGRCWRVRKISPPPGFDTGRSESLYRLWYPGQPIFGLFLMSIANNRATVLQLFNYLLDLEVRLSLATNRAILLRRSKWHRTCLRTIFSPLYKSFKLLHRICIAFYYVSYRKLYGFHLSKFFTSNTAGNSNT